MNIRLKSQYYFFLANLINNIINNIIIIVGIENIRIMISIVAIGLLDIKFSIAFLVLFRLELAVLVVLDGVKVWDG